MVITPLYSHPTPPLLLLYLLLSTTTPTLSLNITSLLSPFPDLSRFSSLLFSTAVSDDLSTVTSLTLLALPNSLLSPPTPPNIADILRYHILLQYLSPSDLRRLPPSGRLVTTLFQSNTVSGTVNITRNLDTNLINIELSDNNNDSSNITVISCLRSIPFNVTIYLVDAMLMPTNVDIMASETQPPLGLNITKALLDGHDFNIAAAMVEASGVSDELESDETGAGITLFIPTDDSFSDLPPNVKIQSLTADKKAVLLKYHVLHSYYPLGSLESIVNPVQPTLATELVGAGDYTLNISRVNGSVGIDSGLIQASVTQTVFDEKPIVIFGINRVLLPKEIFGNTPIKMTMPLINGGVSLPGVVVVPPETKTELEPPSQLSVVGKSEATRRKGLGRYIVSMYCILFLYVYVSE